ncbi:hypothetical protein MSG28_006288 [Choristoneura fumiferana]|uniref:Uncharacterized protein n=1 Tax=Choristoneura fumiferana TaxID=7141 RepID=A0ACC0JE74_CHOFU|nr:hypothetical protein MSG28_006288 [Choristoneura fumiferana]
METCRACLSASKDLSQVDETFLSSYNSLTNLNVRPFDGFPECFCRTCMDTVHLFIKFREKCISSEKALREVDLTVKSSRPLDVECELDVLIKREDEGDSFHETCHYGLVDFEIKNEFKKEESVVVFENEAAQMAIGDSLKVKVVRRKRKCIGGGRPKRKSLSNTAKAKCEVNKSSDEYFCGLCDESFIVLDSLKEHLEGHHTDKSCGICFKEFENWPKLLTHRVFHSAKKYCHLCPRRFSSIFKMEEHYLTVHYEEKNHKKRRHKKFTCKICERRFADASRLKNHVCKDKSKLCPKNKETEQAPVISALPTAPPANPTMASTTKYNPANLQTLERYVDMQSRDNTYDLEANLSVLKLYQFNPEKFNTENETISQIKYLADILEQCDFAQFWNRVHQMPELCNRISGFHDSIRKFVCHVVGITFQTIEKDNLANLLGGIDDVTLKHWVKKYGWRDDGNLIFIANQDENIKTKNITEKIEFDHLAPLMALL